MNDDDRPELHPMHLVAKMFAPAELELVAQAQALEKLDPEELGEADGMPGDVLGIVKQEMRTR